MIQKQISIFLPVEQWRELRMEAAQLRIPITELCRRLMDAGRPYVNVHDDSEMEGQVASC